MVATCVNSDVAAQESEAVAHRLDLRVEAEWDSDRPRFWIVRLRVDDPEDAPLGSPPAITDLVNQSQSPDTTGAFSRADDGAEIVFRPRRAVRGGAVQMRIQASSRAQLSLEISAVTRRGQPAQPTEKHAIGLVELVTPTEVSETTDGENVGESAIRWTVKRVEGDEFRLESMNESIVHESGDPIAVQVHANSFLLQRSTSLMLDASLYRLDDGETVTSVRRPLDIDEHGNSDPLVIELTGSDRPGVYEVRCELLQSADRIWGRLRRRTESLRVDGIPIVVRPLGPNAPRDVAEPDPTDPNRDASTDPVSFWKPVGTIRPHEPAWSVGKWLPDSSASWIPSSRAIQLPGSANPSSPLEKRTYLGKSTSVIPAGSTFRTLLPVERPGIAHRITLKIPSTRTATLKLEVTPETGSDRSRMAVVIPASPGTSTEPWQTYTVVCYPLVDDHVALTNLDEEESIVFESIQVTAAVDHPDDAVHARASEDRRQAVLRVRDLDWVASMTRDVDAIATSPETKLAGCKPATIQAYRLWLATERLQHGARTSGVGAILLPASDRGHAAYPTSLYTPCRDGQATDSAALTTTLRLLERSGFQVYVGLRIDAALPGVEMTMLQSPTKVGEMLRPGRGERRQYDLLNEVVQQHLQEIVTELNQQCAGFECYTGLVLDATEGSHTQPLDNTALRVAYRRYLEKQNAATTSSGLNDPKATSMRQWLSQRVDEAYREILKGTPKRTLVLHEAYQAEAFHDVVDTQAYAPLPLVRQGLPGNLDQRSEVDEHLSFIAAAWPSGASAVAFGMQNRLAGEQVPRLYGQRHVEANRIVDRLDPTLMFVDFAAEWGGVDPQLSHWLSSYTQLPNRGLRELAYPQPTTQTVRVRTATIDGRPLVAISNLAPWSNELELTADHATRWSIAGVDHRDAATLINSESGAPRTRVDLAPGQLVVLVNAQQDHDCQVEAWSATPRGGNQAVDDIREKVSSIIERIGVLPALGQTDALSNGGFEQSGNVGLVGWMHAQHPPGCVRVDEAVFVEGSHSLVMTTDESLSSRTWLVSEILEAPDSGRLAVSLACLAQPQGIHPGTGNPHRLRVSIEAISRGAPVRFTNELAIQRTGDWQSYQYALEADGIDPARVSSLRLTIDSLSGGQIWIDDVKLHDRFPTAKERRELQSEAFLAVQGLQRGNLAPAGRLLQNQWAHELLSRAPSITEKSVIETVQEVDERPGMAERIRNWLPRPMRF